MTYSFSCEIHFVVQNQEKKFFSVSKKLLTEEKTYWNDPDDSFDCTLYYSPTQGFVVRPGHENLVAMGAISTIAEHDIHGEPGPFLPYQCLQILESHC